MIIKTQTPSRRYPRVEEAVEKRDEDALARRQDDRGEFIQGEIECREGGHRKHV